MEIVFNDYSSILMQILNKYQEFMELSSIKYSMNSPERHNIFKVMLNIPYRLVAMWGR